MKNEFYSSHNLSFKEKRNKIGRYALIITLTISTLLTLVVVFFMTINNLGISPSDQQGFKGVRFDVGESIINNFQSYSSPIKDVKHTIKHGDSTIYSFKLKETEDSIKYEETNMTSSYYINIDKTKSTFEEGGENTSLIGKVKTYEEALGFIEASVKTYETSYLSYKADYYKNITGYQNRRYFYNAEKRLLKFAGQGDEYIIVDDHGQVVKGTINVRGKNDPLLYKINRTTFE